ncbi:hypothetical protein J416_14173 [Gracilibacillus halophilus YIM-C55.5]|uniref:SHS2 domain-containing protein n=1 Tax=Gracilibacillus halophilus YIM-C55.5 TaxID=1308866 RepID=N4W6E6_9BACI|nr:cell division FtsA domain-containing protein [Gracilibacillus halophilus]ENH95788.1 hypothetical protein J416_14173 [Gracilibacillus halophilus YIM-C55.5]
MDEQMFALDIGTRSVIGLLMTKKEDGYQLLDYYAIEHEERSMLDGQIHDIVSVANVIQRVKLMLEERHDIVLDQVCVAAAGRALKTKRIQTNKEIETQPLMSEEDILLLELEGVQKAQYELASEQDQNTSSDYYCVGYSVIRYLLDGEEIGSLIDQQGQTAEADIIATFLPRVVVESLLAALQRADLELEALTLEPIAAIHVLIPPSMRRLNVALVDIGAGTSDIALTSEGTITAYGMVPKAGDEITEAISDHYLLDFNVAEDVKKDITIHKKAMIEDILGFQQEESYESLVEVVLPAVERLAKAITEEIITLNGEAPKAVMLVGGGSQTPELSKMLAKKLKLPANRVAIRGVDAIQSLQKTDDIPIGPEFITPIGIAIAAKQNPVHYVSIKVNERMIRLFEMKKLTVADGLLAAGINIQKLYGKPGMASIITYHGKQVTLPGTFGSPPTILLNHELASVEDPIQNGDQLSVTRGEDGASPELTVAEFIGDIEPIHILFDGQKRELKPILTVNQQSVSPTYVLADGDDVTFSKQHLLQDFIQKELSLTDTEQPFIVWIDEEKVTLNEYSQRILVNGERVNRKTPLKHGDQITYEEANNPTVQELFDHLDEKHEATLRVTYNDQPIILSKPLVQVYRAGEELTLNSQLQHQDKLQFVRHKETPFIFQDIFRFISLELSSAKGRVQLKRNGEPATFFDELQPNDTIEITFE